jgi:hypothetical protein
MPEFPSPADGAVPPVGDSALDELLTSGQPPQDAAAGLEPVAAVLAALRAGPADGELASQARVLAEFRSTVRVSDRAGRARRLVPLRERLGSRLAVITTAAAVAVAGTAGAAYVGVLPGPIQQAAHDVIAAAPVPGGAPDGHAAPAAIRAHRLHRPSLPAITSPVTGTPSPRHGQPWSARKQHKHHHKHHGHKGRWGAHHQDVSGDQNDNGPTARRDANQMAHHKGSRLQLPLPRAAASLFRPQVPTGRGPAGAEPRVRVPTPGGPGPRSSH